MIGAEGKQFIGAIYDVDDTLLDNHRPEFAPYNLHEHSRFLAIQAIALEDDIHPLASITHKQNWDAFLDAPEHTVEGAVWLLLTQTGLVAEGPIDRDHELVVKITERKAELHMELLRENGIEVKGASTFVRTLGRLGVPQAIASGARHDEIAVYIDRYGLQELLPIERTIAKGDYANPKPHPESFDLAFRTLGLPNDVQTRNRVLAFEDDPKGVISAREAHLSVCALTTRFAEEKFVGESAADIVVRDFEDPKLQEITFDVYQDKAASRRR